jgi:medium-chain acyl-[acyl-carrier-protein] hydrolase
MENYILKTQFAITSADTDMNARLRLGALVNLLIQSAVQSADNLGFGFNNLKDHNLIWVLSRLELHITKPLYWNETVVVETWPKSIEKLFYTRDFIITNHQGIEVARATSAWLAIDQKSRRPKLIEGTLAERFNQLKHYHAIEHFPDKLEDIQTLDSVLVTPQFFDFDLNGHVTSTRYIDWIMDSFDYKYHSQHYPSFLSINYLKEVLPSEPINLLKQVLGAHLYQFEGVNLNQNCASYRAKLHF